MVKTLKVGVIGVGVIGNAHLQSYTKVRDAKVVAISDINEKSLKSAARKFKVKKAFTDYHDLLALDDIDAINICTPPSSHVSVACDAASEGKHVLCEKPMAMNAQEAERMVKACNKAGVKLGICSARSRFEPSVVTARQYIDDGKLGKVYYARFSIFRRRGRPGIDILVDSKWFLDSSKAGGGALIDIGCYDIDVLLYLLGSPQPVSVSAMTFRGIGDYAPLNVPFDVEEHSSVFVRFDGGATAIFETAWASNMQSGEDVMILGTEGGLKLNPFTYYAKMEGRHVALSIDLERRFAGSMEMLLNDFVGACLENKTPKTPGEDGLKVMQIISMAYKSAEISREANLSML